MKVIFILLNYASFKSPDYSKASYIIIVYYQNCFFEPLPADVHPRLTCSKEANNPFSVVPAECLKLF